jgi:pre-rRNA-processing protein IPI1
LLTSRTDSQRRDSLSYLTSSIISCPKNVPLEQPVSLILPKVLPLILNANNDVRVQLLKLLRSLPPDEIGHQVEKLLPYIRAGMTHLAAAIRSSSLELLSWALDAAGQDLVTAPGGWVKILKTFLLMLNWPVDAEISTTGWSTGSRSFRSTGAEDKVFIATLQNLSLFLHVGLVSSFDEKGEDYGAAMARNWPLRHVEQHQLPKRPNAFGYLNLFGPFYVEGSEAYEDRVDRQEEFRKSFQKSIEKGVKALKKEGGEVGRAAAKVDKALTDGMKDFEDPELGTSIFAKA